MDIFVGSIPFKLKEKELRALFEKYGEVTSVKIVKDKATRQNKGFGFVDMPDEDAIRNAIHELNGTELMGREIEVSLSAKKEAPKPVKNFKINHLGKATTGQSFRGIGKGYDKRNKKMKFEEYRIAPEIKQNLEKLGFKKPTDIQYKSITPILRGEDVLAIAQTGTGKTAAFAIPVLNLINETKKSSRADAIRCVVMVPTRELAIQITEVFEKIGQGTKVKTFSLFGGVEQDPQILKLEKGVDILVATPGRMFDLVSQGHLKLNHVEILILDEADHMLDLGFIKDIQDLIRFLPRKRQTLFFSATINETIKKLAYSLVHNAIRIQISPNDKVAKNIQHAVIFVEMDDKRFFLERLVNEHSESKILVFVRTKVRAERVLAAMERVSIKAETLHGDKEQEDRLKVLGHFRTGETRLLIATDVSARGIDIPNVDYVVNYDLPDVPENYVHRVGRTGRGTQKGNAISFCSTEEKPVLAEIEAYLNKPVQVMEIDKLEYAATKDFSQDVTASDLKALLKEAEQFEEMKRKKGKSKK